MSEHGQTTRTYGRYRVEISNADKVFFPAEGITKGDLIDYYERIADAMLAHVDRRAIAMQRFPDGIRGEGFYQKQAGDYFPEWITTTRVKTASGSQDLVVCDKKATLVYLANQAVVTVHAWLSRSDKPRHPDQLVIDLDPPGDDFARARHAARCCRTLLDELGLTAYLKTTGSHGLHVVVPLDRSEEFDEVRAFARAAAEVLAAREPRTLTVEQRKNKRRGRVYLDVGRNAYAQTAVAAYSVRARPAAPVATPIDWKELDRGSLHARTYTVKNIFRRLGAGENEPWAGMHRRAHSLRRARKILERMADEARS